MRHFVSTSVVGVSCCCHVEMEGGLDSWSGRPTARSQAAANHSLPCCTFYFLSGHRLRRLPPAPSPTHPARPHHAIPATLCTLHGTLTVSSASFSRDCGAAEPSAAWAKNGCWLTG